jgi:hypothetical protein
MYFQIQINVFLSDIEENISLKKSKPINVQSGKTSAAPTLHLAIRWNAHSFPTA